MFTEKLKYIFETHGDRNAFCIGGNHYSYTAFAARVAAIQQQLISGYGDKERIGIVLGDSIDTYAAIVATLCLGKTYVPLHPGHPADRTKQIIEQASLGVIISAIATALTDGTDNINSCSLPSGQHEIVYSAEDISQSFAYILFTSGSTGVPKGTPVTYRNLDAFIDAFFALGYDISAEDRFMQMFDLTFDLSVMACLVPLCVGACVCTLPEKGMKYTNVYSVLEEQRITFALMVPSILSFLRPYFDEIRLPDMRYSLFCGEALHKEVVVEWAKCIPNAVIENVYGPTEATIFCLTYNVDPAGSIIESNGVVCIGKPMLGMEAIVVDEMNREVPEGEKGELCLFGGQVTPGYLDAEKTAAAFFELNGKRYYRTGDIAFRYADGNFIYAGRADHQVKIQGFRVELGEIEHHARTMYECNAVAMPVNNGQGLSQIDIILEREAVDTASVISGLKSKLPSYMVPSNVHFIAPFPLNVNGKTDRKALGKIIEAIV